jgi:hypothetical protein
MADTTKNQRTVEQPVSGHRFNNDLLIDPSDLDRAGRGFSQMMHVLSHVSLQDTFRRFDRLGNAAKRKGRIAGLLAILLGTTALAIAAATPKAQGWGLIAAICGVFSIGIGLGGALYAGAKRRWLCNRVMTERLRQFHFQAFVCRWREIAGTLAGPDAARAYIAQRETWFDRFIAPYPGQLDAELTDLLDDETASKCWLHPKPSLPKPGEIIPDLEGLFAAYHDLRISHQLHYANYKLRSNQKMFSWSPRLQEVIFSYAVLICILAIFVIHLWIAFSIALGGRIPGPEEILLQRETETAGTNVHVIVIWIAIAALAVRALQEGLQPEREIERYRHYRAGVRALRDRFDEARSPLEKLEVMLEMERLSFDEFRNFLRSSSEARFII